VARGIVSQCKPDSQLRSVAARSKFWVGGEWIMEIRVKMKLRFQRRFGN